MKFTETAKWSRYVELQATGSFVERGGTTVAQDVLTGVLGEEFVRTAAHHAMTLEPGAEVARSVLQLLRAPVAMQECWAVFQEPSSDDERRRLAVRLLASICDETAEPWVLPILEDAAVEVAVGAVAVVAEIAMQGHLSAEQEDAYLARFLGDSRSEVREAAVGYRTALEHERARQEK